MPSSDPRTGYTPYLTEMREPFEFRTDQRNAPPTVKEKGAVQRAVTNLLNTLAPERATKRTESVPVPIEQYRTPSGCVLQAATAALSVSWFPDAATDAGLGELQVVLWRGVVTRRGAGATRERATLVSEMNLRPVEDSIDASEWRDKADRAIYDIRRLADYCLTLLKEQMLADDATGGAMPATPRRRD